MSDYFPPPGLSVHLFNDPPPRASFALQDGGASRDCLKACVAVPGEESFVLAGKTHVLRTDSVAADDSVNNTYYEGDTDYVAIKLDKDGNEVWRWQVRVRERGRERGCFSFWVWWLRSFDT